VIFVVINEEVLRNLFTMKKDNGWERKQACI
jgi:hypothetical protein